MKKFTDEQLSRILGEHDAGYLSRGGHIDFGLCCSSTPECCVNQAAYIIPGIQDAYDKNRSAGEWFDVGYLPEMSADNLLAILESL